MHSDVAAGQSDVCVKLEDPWTQEPETCSVSACVNIYQMCVSHRYECLDVVVVDCRRPGPRSTNPSMVGVVRVGVGEEQEAQRMEEKKQS